MGELICVLSGKGGTGKTSVCAGVATALTLSGERVLCIDCDIGLRNLDLALGLADYGALSFFDVCQGGYDLDKAAAHPKFPGLYFLTAPTNPAISQIDPAAFSDMLEQARQSFSYIFLDAPAGLGEGFSLAAAAADRILLVTGPDPAAIRDAGQTAAVLELMGKTNVRLIVNRISKKLTSALRLTVDDIMDQSGLPLLGVVPEDPSVLLSAAAGQPLFTGTNRGAAAACRRIAKRIQGHAVPIAL